MFSGLRNKIQYDIGGHGYKKNLLPPPSTLILDVYLSRMWNGGGGNNGGSWQDWNQQQASIQV